MPTYNQLESGFDTSKPVELYRFVIDTEKYFYCSGDVDLEHEGDLYLKSTIRRGKLEGTSDPDKGTIDLTVPYTLPIVTQVMTTPPSVPVNLTIFRGQRGALPFFTQIWIGRISAHEVVGSEVSLRGISLLSNQYRLGNALRFQKACPYALYDSYNCRVSPIDYQYICSPDIVTASKVSSASLVWSTAGIPSDFKEGWYIGGYVEYDDTISNVVGKRAIIDYDHEGGVVTVFPPLRGFITATAMKFHPGCAHDSRSCKLKFDNIPNYGGDPIMPVEDPFDPNVEVF